MLIKHTVRAINSGSNDALVVVLVSSIGSNCKSIYNIYTQYMLYTIHDVTIIEETLIYML